MERDKTRQLIESLYPDDMLEDSQYGKRIVFVLGYINIEKRYHRPENAWGDCLIKDDPLVQEEFDTPTDALNKCEQVAVDYLEDKKQDILNDIRSGGRKPGIHLKQITKSIRQLNERYEP